MQSQEQQKKDACMKSLHTKQDSLRIKLCALLDSLDEMKGRLHDEKSKRRKVMFDEELKRKRLENEIQDLNDWIFELDNERKVAEKNEKAVREKYYNAVRDAQYRHHRWHQERDKRCYAENKMAEQDKHAKKQEEMYSHLLEDFNEIRTDPKRSMQNELARYNWGPMSMGRVIDTLNDAMGEIYKTPSLILDDKYDGNLRRILAGDTPLQKILG
jgi:hypothetical protein